MVSGQTLNGLQMHKKNKTKRKQKNKTTPAGFEPARPKTQHILYSVETTEIRVLPINHSGKVPYRNLISKRV